MFESTTVCVSNKLSTKMIINSDRNCKKNHSYNEHLQIDTKNVAKIFLNKCTRATTLTTI